MILVDTSIWVGHLLQADPELIRLLDQSEVVTHPMVIGEMALRPTNDRDLVLGLLGNLPMAPVATHAEVMALVTNARLYGHGLTLVGAHLLASARLAAECSLWTRDASLAAVAQAMGIGWLPPTS